MMHQGASPAAAAAACGVVDRPTSSTTPTRAAARRPTAAFGNGDVYVEQFLPRARHVEVQIVGDGPAASRIWASASAASSAATRSWSRSRPAPTLPTRLRERIIDAAVRARARASRYSSLGTFEFLVDARRRADARRFVFIEANARLQVEHTVTEEVTGVDLVAAAAAPGRRRDAGRAGSRPRPGRPRRGAIAIQARVNMETMAADGSTTARPAAR